MPPSSRDTLVQLLREGGREGGGEAAAVTGLIGELEANAPADLAAPGSLEQLEGVWDLRWSSSRQPYLRPSRWLENLQLLVPSQGRAMNLLRPAGLLGSALGLAVEARIAVASAQRVEVHFQRGGWLGPRLTPTGQRLRLLRRVSQPFPAWLDITVLDAELRICRGSAGTLFALLRRPDLTVGDLLPPLPSE